jgi:hypothetical protein
MKTYFIEYKLDENTTILVQAPADYEPEQPEMGFGPIKAAADPAKQAREGVTQAAKTFKEALEPVRQGARWMLEQLKDLRADEVELKFGLITTGEVGNFAIGKVGVEANYEVTLKWKNTAEIELPEKK